MPIDFTKTELQDVKISLEIRIKNLQFYIDGCSVKESKDIYIAHQESCKNALKKIYESEMD